MFGNKSVYMPTIVWNERRFVESKPAWNAARRCLYRAANHQLNIELKNLANQNNEILHEINRCDTDLQKYNEKLQLLDNMSELATQSLEVYFQTRMENLRSFVSEQCRIIADGIQEEADHWKEIHAMLQQKLVVPGDLRSYGGGNGLPRAVKQSPDFSRILEEDEEEAEEEEEEEEINKNNVSAILQARTLTPLITQTLKNARLRASKLAQDTSMIVPSALNMSTTVHEETFNEEVQSPVKATVNHMTLRDVSAIEREAEMETDMNHSDLSVSLLPFIATVAHENDKKDPNISIRSTISDKTFVKKSLKPSASDEETDEDDTVVEESLLGDSKENIRPLLLTADQSIRIRDPSTRQEKLSLPNKSLEEKPKIKQEKVSFREPIKIHHNNATADRNHLGKTFLLNNATYDAEKSHYVRPTIVVNEDASKLSPIASAESEDEEKSEPMNTSRRVEKRSIDQVLSTSATTTRCKTLKSPLVTQLPPPVPTVNTEISTKRRTTRRTTIRSAQETQNVASSQPAEIPSKTRYQTRYSTRLAGTVIIEETTTSRRTTRLTSE